MMRRSALSRNQYFLLGLFIGLVLSFYIPQDIWEMVQQEECPQQTAENILIEKFGQDFEPHLNLINKPLAAKKPVKNVIRPRYYSSELGIREKVYICVMTSPENINTLATAINRTSAHLVNKIKFFISAADNVKTNYKLKNIVGFTDNRENLRPFHVIKYVADRFLNEYDYFVLMPDTVYVDARKLQQLLYHLSITFDLYMGVSMEGGNRDEFADASADAAGDAAANVVHERNYCDLNAGIILSSSIIRKMRNNLDWCVRNGITNEHSINIGRCVKYSSKLAGCQQSFQGVQQQTFQLQPHIKLFTDLQSLSLDVNFRNASTIYPVTTTDDFYRLHAYFSKHNLALTKARSYDLERKSYEIANGSIANDVLEIRWPLGVPAGSAPETRHDIIMWHLINGTHIFLPNADNVVEPLSRIAMEDFKKILGITLEYAAAKQPHLKFDSLHTVYRKFDATRGMDYQLHLNFHDASRRQRLHTRSYHVVKPLGRVEVVPSPYVTESPRIALLVPTFEHQLDSALNFITQYERICMSQQDNTFLLMVFVYNYDSSSKGETDPFKHVKTLALDLSSKYKTDGSRIAWVSIRLPPIFSDAIAATQQDTMLNSLYARHQFLSIAIADLALPKIGLDSLVMMASTYISFKSDFLNRVRMNTIQGFQVYSPIGFMMYPCKLAHFCKECETCDVSQSTGYFDKWHYDVISFYSRDYVQARKKVEHNLPIMRLDTDIEQLLTRTDKHINTILDMFVASQLPLHILRGVEPNLRYVNAMRHFNNDANDATMPPQCPAQRHDSDNASNVNNNNNNHNNNYSNELPLIAQSNGLSSHQCIHLASRKQIGDAIIRYEDKSILFK